MDCVRRKMYFLRGIALVFTPCSWRLIKPDQAKANFKDIEYRRLSTKCNIEIDDILI